MLPFLLYSTRREKVEWLMDQYTENRALYPCADFSFIGHSNGTYLLARALEDYPACRFKNVVFAGSVVHQKYDWSRMIANKRIGGIINLVASADWVVAIFPKALQTLKLQDLGSGGHDGFSLLEPGSQLRYLKGSHGAGIKEELWDTIADFIIHGPSSALIVGSHVEKQNRVVKFLGIISPLLFLIGIAIFLCIGLIIGYALKEHIYLQILSLILYIVTIWKIITKL
jgi:pimeloyl-ACP methyl ester carboxylesterase